MEDRDGRQCQQVLRLHLQLDCLVLKPGVSHHCGVYYLTCFQATVVKPSMLLRLFCSVEAEVMTSEMSALSINGVQVGPHVRVHPACRLPRKKRCRRPGCRPLTCHTPSWRWTAPTMASTGPAATAIVDLPIAADPARRVRQWRLRLLCVAAMPVAEEIIATLCAFRVSACALNATAGQKRDAPRKK